MNLSSNLDMAFTDSSGRKKFQPNEIFSEANSSTVAVVEFQPRSSLPSIQFGLLKENSTSLGLSGSGAFNSNNNEMTSFAGLSNSINLLGGKLFGSVYWGRSPGISNQDGMISSFSDLESSAFGLGFLKTSVFTLGDQFILTIDQPIRVESGKLNLSIPVYRTKEKNVIFNSFGFDLDPSGREINSKAEYSTSYKNIGLGFTMGYKSDPYHIKLMQDYWYASLGFNIKI